MSTGKELKFQFVLDTQSFQQVKRALGELTTEAQKFAKAMQSSGMGGGGGGVGVFGGNTTPAQAMSKSQSRPKQGLGAAILGDVESFQKLAKSGKDSFAAMTGAVRGAVREQMQEIDKLDAKMARLQERFKKDPRAAYEGAFRSNLERQMLARQGQLNTANENLTGLRGAAANAGVDLGHLGGPRAPGMSFGQFISQDLTGGRGPRGMMEAGMDTLLGPSMAGMIARSVGMAVAGGIKIVNTSVAADGMGASLYAQEGRAMRPFVDAFKTRDASMLGKMKSLKYVLGDKEAAAQAISSVAGSDADAKRMIEGFTDLAKGMAGGELTASQLTDVARDSKKAEALSILIGQAGDIKEHALGRGGAEEYLNQTRGERLAASQISGRGINIKNGRVVDSFTPWAAKLHEDGFTTSQALQGELASAHGAGSGQFGWDIMSSQAAGWGGYGNILTAAARMAGTGGARGLATLGLGGGISRGAGMQLAQGVLGTGFDPRGTTGMAGVLSAFQGGYGSMLGKGADPALQFNAVNQYLAGLQTGSATTMGATSPFQLGMNVLGAVGAMPGSSMYHQDMLAQRFDMKQMMAGASGTLTGTMADVARLTGMDKTTFQKQIDSSFGGSLAQWADTGANDGVSLAMRKFRKSGKGLRDFAKTASKDDLTALGIAQAEITGGDLEGSIGSMFALKGLGHKGVGGAAPAAGKPDTAEAATRANEAQAMKDAASRVAQHMPAIVKDLSAVREAGEGTMTGVNALVGLMAAQMGLSKEEVQKIFETSSTVAATTSAWQWFTGTSPADRARAAAEIAADKKKKP